MYKKIIGNTPLQGFKPDCEIIIKHESSTGQTMIASGNGVPLNPLFVCSLLVGIVDQNIRALMEVQLKTQCNKPHPFTALAGETKCRVPYCTMPAEHEIHSVSQPVAS